MSLLLSTPSPFRPYYRKSQGHVDHRAAHSALAVSCESLRGLERAIARAQEWHCYGARTFSGNPVF